MRRSATEILQELEVRVAELEKEAGFIDDLSSTFNGLVNIPKNIVKKIINGFLALLEKAMYRWVVNTDEYDEMVEGKTASQYPALTYLTYKLETL